MRSELGKECRKLFRKMMATEFPKYQEDKGQIAPQGWYAWTYRHSDDLFFHILLVIHETRDQFTIEGEWGHDGKLLDCLSDVHDILSAPSYVRVAELWSDEEYWWLLVLRPEEYDRAFTYGDDPIEECLPLVAPAVADAAKKLKEHLIPVFEKVAEKHGNGPQNKGGSQQPQEQS
jgi:hypothetical protein